MGVDPDDRDAVVARRQCLDGPDVSAAAAPEDECPFGKLEREDKALLGQRLLGDDCRLRVGKREVRRLGHLLATGPPRTRNPHEASAERPSARVALVLRPECDRRVRPALGALGA